jgi:hypothetical protein
LVIINRDVAGDGELLYQRSEPLPEFLCQDHVLGALVVGAVGRQDPPEGQLTEGADERCSGRNGSCDPLGVDADLERLLDDGRKPKRVTGSYDQLRVQVLETA